MSLLLVRIWLQNYNILPYNWHSYSNIYHYLPLFLQSFSSSFPVDKVYVDFFVIFATKIKTLDVCTCLTSL